LVEHYNQERFIEAFVEKLDLIKLSLVTKTIKSEGRPSFNPKVFLKLYFYGYPYWFSNTFPLVDTSNETISLNTLNGRMMSAVNFIILS